MPRYLFTFEPCGSAKVLLQKDAEEGELFYAVYASKYKPAINKVLKMDLPLIEKEEDLVLISVQEETDLGDDEEKVLEKK